MTVETLDLDALLQGTLLKVAEQLAFMFGKPAPRDELDLAGYAFLRSEMAFGGQVGGTLCVALPEAAAREIAANILGLEPGDPQSLDMAADALGEMLNVICGEVVRTLVGADSDFTLHPPYTEPLDPSGLDGVLPGGGYAGFILDGYPGFFGLTLEDDD